MGSIVRMFLGVCVVGCGMEVGDSLCLICLGVEESKAFVRENEFVKEQGVCDKCGREKKVRSLVG